MNLQWDNQTLIIDPADQQDREINNQGADPEIMYSSYSTDHLEDLEWSDNKYNIFFTSIDVCSITENTILYIYVIIN